MCVWKNAGTNRINWKKIRCPAATSVSMIPWCESVACRQYDSSGFCLFREFRLAGTVEDDCLANERFEGGFVDFYSFVGTDRTTRVSV